MKVRRLRLLSRVASVALALFVAGSATNTRAQQIVPGSMDVHWNPGAADCKTDTQPPLQVHQYEPQTYILRQNLCLSPEGNFLFLLIGDQKALLIDTGAIADAAKMPVAKTVLGLLPQRGDAKLPLLVVHTHSHTDHRDGDVQFAGLPGVQVAPFDVDGVKKFFNLPAWPEGQAQIDLGGRTVDVIPSPGHNRAHVVYYDQRTGLLLTGDFFLPGRLLVEDNAADLASAARVIDFVKTRPVTWVLGTHIELNQNWQLYDLGASYHPDEHVLQLTKDDLLTLPATLAAFNGFYTTAGHFTVMDQNRVLGALAIAALVIIICVIWGLWRLWRRMRRKPAVSA
jgi:glyoxylase-like metal-dependent hydrolase (beta-lactamase superfamily II)